MFERLKALFEGRHPLAKDAQGGVSDDEMRVATAVLLLEAGYGDQELLPKEAKTIIRSLEREFGLSADEAREIAGRAEAIRPPAVTLKDLTDVLRAGFSHEQRRRILALIWKVVEADHEETEWEESFFAFVKERLALTDQDSEIAQQMSRRGEV